MSDDADRLPTTRLPRVSVARWPAVPAAVLFGVGIVAHRHVPPWTLAWLVAMAGLLVLAWRALHSPRTCSSLLMLAFFAAGLVAGQVEAFHYPRSHVSAFAAEESRLAQLELRVEDPPRVLSNPFDRRRPLPPKQVVTAEVTRVNTWAGWEDAGGQILVQIAEPHPRLGPGQTVRVVGMLQRPSAAMNPGQFDWARYYREQRILASITVPQAVNVTIVRDDGPGLLCAMREKVRRWLAAGFPAERALDHALLRALLLGDKDPQLRDVQEQFQRTGTSHHLAISGMHIAVLGGFVYFICRVLCLPPRWSAWAMLAFVVLYGAMALPSPPVWRSVLLCAAVGLGLVGRRALDMVQLLAISVLVMLAYHPLDLYNPGFQLSFGTVLGLMLLTGPAVTFIRSFREKERDRDVQIAASLQPITPLRAACGWADRSACATLAAGVVAWWVSMPLIAYHFEQLHPWAILAGIALAPVVFVALVLGMLKVVLTALWPALAETWADLAAQPVAAMRGVVDWLATWPGGSVPVPPPPWWLVLIFYALLLPMLMKNLGMGTRVWLWVGRATAAALILFFPLQRALDRSLSPGGEVKVTLLAVGAGQCAVVQPPSGRTVLIDAGSTSLSDLTGKCLGPFLRHGRCTEIDTVMISHANVDHFSAVTDLVEGYAVREVLTGAHFARHSVGNPAAEEMLAALDRVERPPRRLSPGDHTPLGADTEIEVLWPPPDQRYGYQLIANDASLVLKLTHAGRSILFPGDIQDPAMKELLTKPERLKADVLVAPHHGSGETLTKQFVQAVGPSVIVSSNDRTLTNKQRAFESMTGGLPVYRTHRCGSITVTLTRDGEIRVKPFWDVPPVRK